MKFKSSIQKKILIFIPLVIVSIVILSIFSYSFAKSELETQITDKMHHLSNEVVNEIDGQLISHQRIGESMSAMAGATGTEFTHTDYQLIFEQLLALNDDTFGMGVWFEPFSYDEEIEYIGPYAYKDGEAIIFTDEYETASYDYPSHDWYRAGADSGDVSWTAPYFDEALGTTLITTSIPFYNNMRTFSGVVSSGIDIGNLQSMVAAIDTGTSGQAFLLGKNQEFIVDTNGETNLALTLANDEELSSLHDVINQDASGVHQLTLADGDAHVYYQHIPRTDWTLALIIPDKEAYAALSQLLIQVAVVATSIIVLFAVISVVLARKLSNPIKLLNREVSKVAEGDLSVYLEPRTTDEIGELTKNFNVMVNNISGLVTSVRSSIHTVSDSTEQLSAVAEETTAASEEISRAMNEAAKGTSDAANYAEKTNEQTLGLSNRVTTLVEQTGQLRVYSGEVQQLNKHGVDQMDVLKEKSRESNEVVMKIESVIQQLSGEMSEIGTIVKTIRGISEQTNLLALNASIEAARAGEHGRGFAVVAEEVRKLAEETSSATENISETIKMVQIESDNAVGEIIATRSISDAQNKAAEDSSQLFERISIENDRMINAIETIGSDINNIAIYKDGVVESIGHIAAILEQTAAATEEVDASAEEQLVAIKTITTSAENLQDSGEELEKIINTFKLKD